MLWLLHQALIIGHWRRHTCAHQMNVNLQTASLTHAHLHSICMAHGCQMQCNACTAIENNHYLIQSTVLCVFVIFNSWSPYLLMRCTAATEAGLVSECCCCRDHFPAVLLTPL